VVRRTRGALSRDQGEDLILKGLQEEDFRAGTNTSLEQAGAERQTEVILSMRCNPTQNRRRCGECLLETAILSPHKVAR
jgi:hypothetical protein